MLIYLLIVISVPVCAYLCFLNHHHHHHHHHPIIDAHTHSKADIVIDCTGLLIVPGFIDIQINGAFGVDFSTLPEDPSAIERDVQAVSKGLLQFGVTSFCPSKKR